MTSSIGARIKPSIKRFAATAALSLCAALGGTGAQAALVVGTWDPAFGPALPNLGFRGIALFYIPDACLLSAGVKTSGVGCSSGDPMRIESAKVELYNLSNEVETLETLWYVTPPVSNNDALNEVLVQAVGPGFEVTALDTDALGPVASSISEAGGNAFYLDFFSSFCFDCEGFSLPDGAAFAPQADPPQPKERFAAQIFFICGDAIPGVCDAGGRAFSNAAPVTLTRLPEPAMPALLAGALLALGLARRTTRGARAS